MTHITRRTVTGEADLERMTTLARASVTEHLHVVDLPWRLTSTAMETPANTSLLIGFCVCWLLERSETGHQAHEGQIEPLGVHPHVHRQCIGQALLLEGLRRLQAHGAVIARVETDTHRSPARLLYESVGYRVAATILKYAQVF